MSRADRKAARAELRSADKAQRELDRALRAAGVDWETDEWLAANARTDAAIRACPSRRVLALAASVVADLAWLAGSFFFAGLTIMGLGTGMWARIFAASNFLTIYFLPETLTWIDNRVFPVREMPRGD